MCKVVELLQRAGVLNTSEQPFLRMHEVVDSALMLVKVNKLARDGELTIREGQTIASTKFFEVRSHV